ncbi:MFS general substrate transporter [Pholiota conissans]|uniref:MFS general substrate transporter n=1 Tax=Pholiota conissans TaxID=109636 RepID=A0A9P5Z4G4_9AGAR|nr:MFS general substrate transporter [Pholiota conissans]
MPSSDTSRERDTSRPRASRRTTPDDALGPYVNDPESLILPDGLVDEATELLGEFVHPHNVRDDTLIGTSDDEDEADDERDKKFRLPWWKRPSPAWLIAAMPLTAIAMAMTIAPRIEVYTMLACNVHKPDIFKQNHPGVETNSSTLHKLNLGTFAQRSPDALSTTSLAPIYQSFSTNNTTPLTPRNKCASDPVVQAAVAKLTAVIATTMGVLSFVTTGWWGAFSDRHGRTRVMGLSVLGIVVADINFIGVATFWKYLPGGYWLLVIGPLIEGFLGGMTTGIAASNSYMADTTGESTRSRFFSLSLGLLFTGMAIGPTVGSLLIRFTGQTLSVFYAALAIHIIYTFFVFGIIPESLTKKRMNQAKAKYASELLSVAQEREQNHAVGLLVRSRKLFAFLSPLTIFMPEEKDAVVNPLKAPKKDWNLTLMALGYAITITVMGSYSVTFQYAASTFNWTSEIIGYWLSLIGATRAIFLTAVLPLAIKLFKPKPIIIIERPQASPSRETAAFLSSSASATTDISDRAPPKPFKKEIHTPHFDLNLARTSLFIDIISYAFMARASTPTAFTLGSIMGAFGTGFSPAMQSVTLALYARRGGTETGRLFGALSVLQALCSQILGPALYSYVYANTVAIHPRAIFYVSVATVSVSFILLGFVRLPSERDYRRESLGDVEELAQLSNSVSSEDDGEDESLAMHTLRAAPVEEGSFELEDVGAAARKRGAAKTAPTFYK